MSPVRGGSPRRSASNMTFFEGPLYGVSSLLQCQRWRCLLASENVINFCLRAFPPALYYLKLTPNLTPSKGPPESNLEVLHNSGLVRDQI